MAIQSQMIPLMCCHFCDLGARPALQRKRRKLYVCVCACVCGDMCTYMCVCACLSQSRACTDSDGAALVLIYSLKTQLVPT